MIGRWRNDVVACGDWIVLDEHSIRYESKEYSQTFPKLIGQCRLFRDVSRYYQCSMSVRVETEKCGPKFPVFGVTRRIRDYDVSYVLDLRVDYVISADVDIRRIYVYRNGSNWYTATPSDIVGSQFTNNVYGYWIKLKSIDSMFENVSNTWSFFYSDFTRSIQISLNGRLVGNLDVMKHKSPVDSIESIDCYVDVIRSTQPITLRTCDRSIVSKI